MRFCKEVFAVLVLQGGFCGFGFARRFSRFRFCKEVFAVLVLQGGFRGFGFARRFLRFWFCKEVFAVLVLQGGFRGFGFARRFLRFLRFCEDEIRLLFHCPKYSIFRDRFYRKPQGAEESYLTVMLAKYSSRKSILLIQNNKRD